MQEQVESTVDKLLEDGVVRLVDNLTSKGECNRLFNMVINELYAKHKGIRFRVFSNDYSIVLVD